MESVRYVDRTQVLMPEGTNARIKEAAAKRHQRPSEWMRQVIFRALEASERSKRK